MSRVTLGGKNQKKPLKLLIKEALLTGISYSIPLIVGGGTISFIALLFAKVESAAELVKLFSYYGTEVIGITIPVFAGYVAYTLGGKPALAPGLAGGVAANIINSGFIGGIIAGLLAGYIMKYIKKIKINESFRGFKTFYLYPALGCTLLGVLMLFILGPILSRFNTYMIEFLTDIQGHNALLLGVIIGFMTCFDLGGPINKGAYAFCIGALLANNGEPYAAMAAAMGVPCYAVSIATRIFKGEFDEVEVENGRSAWLLGLVNISEGAMPFLLDHPKSTIPAMVIGGSITSGIVISNNISLMLPGAGILSIFIMQQAIIWIGAIAIGSSISAILLVLFRRYMKGDKVEG